MKIEATLIVMTVTNNCDCRNMAIVFETSSRRDHCSSSLKSESC